MREARTVAAGRAQPQAAFEFRDGEMRACAVEQRRVGLRRLHPFESELVEDEARSGAEACDEAAQVQHVAPPASRASVSACTTYVSQRRPSGSLAQTFVWLA